MFFIIFGLSRILFVDVFILVGDCVFEGWNLFWIVGCFSGGIVCSGGIVMLIGSE